jgi:hypothetical protein
MSDVEEGLVQEKADNPQLEQLFSKVDEYSDRFLAFQDQRRYALEEQRWVLARLRDVMVRTVEYCESPLAADLLPKCLEDLRVGFNLLESRFRIDSGGVEFNNPNSGSNTNSGSNNNQNNNRVLVFTKKRPAANYHFAKRQNNNSAATYCDTIEQQQHIDTNTINHQ